MSDIINENNIEENETTNIEPELNSESYEDSEIIDNEINSDESNPDSDLEEEYNNLKNLFAVDVSQNDNSEIEPNNDNINYETSDFSYDGDDSFSDISDEKDNTEYENEEIDTDNNADVYDYDNNAISDESVLRRINDKVNGKISKFKSFEKKKKIKIISFVSAIFLIIILILTDYIPILPNAFNRFYVGNSYVLGETRGGVYDKLGKNVIYADNGRVMSFSNNMDCKFNIETSGSSPKLETSGDNAVVYYGQSGELILVLDNENIKKINHKDIIKGATVNNKGFYGIITYEAGYKSCVNIFSPNHKSIYKWHTNNDIIDIAISDDGKKMAATSYSYENESISGKIFFFDTQVGNPIKEVTTDSNIISEIKYINDDVVAFGDISTLAYTDKGVMKWRIDYNGRNIKSYDINKDGYIAYIFDKYSSEMSESTVEIYNENGKFSGKYESSDNVKYVSANNDYFLLSLDKKTVLLDDDADIIKEKNTKKEFRKAVLFYNYNFAFSINDSASEILSVNH